MTTTTRFVDADGALVLPGEYEIVSTRVIVQAVTRANGTTVDSQDTVIEHTVKPVRALGECEACQEGGITNPAVNPKV